MFVKLDVAYYIYQTFNISLGDNIVYIFQRYTESSRYDSLYSTPSLTSVYYMYMGKVGYTYNSCLK